MTIIAHEGDKIGNDSVLFIRKDGKLRVANSSVQPVGVYSLEDVARARGWMPPIESEQPTLLSRARAMVQKWIS